MNTATMHINQNPHFLYSPLEPLPTAAQWSTCFLCHCPPGLTAFASAGLRRLPKALRAMSPAGGWTMFCWSMLRTELPSWRTTWTLQTLPTGSSSLELLSRYTYKPADIYMDSILHMGSINKSPMVGKVVGRWLHCMLKQNMYYNYDVLSTLEQKESISL